MSAEHPLAGTGFVLAAVPGQVHPKEPLRPEISRPTEETLVLGLAPDALGGRSARLASVDLSTATVETDGGEAVAGLTVLTGRGESRPVPPGQPGVELEPGDSVVVPDAGLALRYEPWGTAQPGGFRAWLRADAAEAARVREAFERFCEVVGVPGPAVHDLALALQEALDNVVEHAYRGRHRGVALVEACLDEASRMVVTVRDRGPAFDPTIAPAPAIGPLAAATPGGLGIHLVRNLVDVLSYERRGGENRLTLTRGLAGT